MFTDPVCPYCGGEVDFNHSSEDQGIGYCADCDDMVQVEWDRGEDPDTLALSPSDMEDADPEFIKEFGDEFDNEEDF